MKINLSNYVPNIFYLTLVALIFVFKVSCVERTHFNQSLRDQLKEFLEQNLRDYKPPSPINDEAILHLFNGLSLYNDHYRFGGILDYCREKGEVRKLIRLF